VGQRQLVWVSLKLVAEMHLSCLPGGQEPVDIGILDLDVMSSSTVIEIIFG
jgi:hypothetical protein